MSLASSSSDTKQLASSQTSSPRPTDSAKFQPKDKKPDVDSKATKIGRPQVDAQPKSDGKAIEAGKRPPTLGQNHGAKAPDAGKKSVKINGRAGASSFFEGLKTGNYTNAGVPPTAVPKVEKTEQQMKSLLKLRVPKSLRKTVGRILQMKPQPKKKEEDLRQEKVAEELRRKEIADKRLEKEREQVRSDRSRATDRDQKPSIRVENRPPPQSSIKPVEKRPRPTEDDTSREPPAKRQKQPNGLDLTQKPRTPIPPPFKSPSLPQQGSAQKSQNPTPKREVKSVAMRRIGSGDGDGKTPQGAASTGTPTAPPSAEKVKPSSNAAPSGSSANGNRNEEVATLRNDAKKYLALGRELKYAADKLLKSKEKDAIVDTISAKQGTAIAMECVLCYMLSFSLTDQAGLLNRQTVDPASWRSLLPYWSFVESRCQRYPLLHGMCLQIGAVIRQIIHGHDLDRLANDPLPTAAADEARPPTPGAEGDLGATETKSKAAAYRKEYAEFKSKLVENARLLQHLWVEGTHKLSVDALRSAFPASWAKSSKGPVARGRERLVPGRYVDGGEFYLPLGGVSTGVEAVRAGWWVLGEWCRGEGVA